MKLLILLLDSPNKGGMYNYASLLYDGYIKNINSNLYCLQENKRINLIDILLSIIGFRTQSIKFLSNTISQFDIIHITDVPYFSFYILRILTNEYPNKKIIYTMHDPLPHIVKSIKNKIIRFFLIVLNKRIFKLSGKQTNLYVHVHSEKLLKGFRNIYNCKFIILQHPIRFIKSDCRKKHDILTITYLGNIEYYKGTDIFTESITQLQEISTPVKYIIAGKGDLNIKPNYCLNVYNYFLSESEYQEILNETDVLILPYREATQSGVLCNSLEHNIPVIVTNVGTFSEYVINNVTGYIIEPNNVDALSEAILKFVKTPNLIEEFSKNIADFKNKYINTEFCFKVLQRINV